MNEDFYINLIYKKLSEEISSEELATLNTWLAESPLNQQVADDVELVWTMSEDFVPTLEQEVDLEVEYESLSKRIAKDESNKTLTYSKSSTVGGSNTEAVIKTLKQDKIATNSRRNWLSVAASIALVFAAGAILWSYFGNTNNEEWVTIATNERSQMIRLPDDSRVHLNANSRLQYVKEFAADERLLELEGEAFFKVQENPNKPFVVKTSEATIKVLGTSFNVRAYDKEETTRVQVVTGKVQFSDNDSNEKLVLTKNNQGVFNRKTNTLAKREKGSSNAFAWHSKKLEFTNVSLYDVVKDLESYYGVSIKVENNEVNKCSFTSTFDDKDLLEVLSSIAVVLGLKVQKINDTEYLLKNGGC